MSRPFSATTPQQAPCSMAARQAALSGATTACSTDQPKNRGTSHNNSATVINVASVLAQPSKKLRRTQPNGPRTASGGGRLSIGVKTTALMRLTLLERRAAGVPVHQRRGQQRQRQVASHHHCDGTDPAASLTERRDLDR